MYGLLNVDRCIWIGTGWGGGGYERSRQEKGLGVTRHTQFGVAVVKSINYFLIVVFEWTSGDWYEHANMYVCVHACVCVLCIYS